LPGKKIRTPIEQLIGGIGHWRIAADRFSPLATGDRSTNGPTVDRRSGNRNPLRRHSFPAVIALHVSVGLAGTITGISAMLSLGGLVTAGAHLGRTAHQWRWTNWVKLDITGMGTS